MTFGEKLQKLRKQNGLSQEQLAEKLNVSRQAISKWEMGTIPDMDNVVKLGRYFDCSLDYLMNHEQNTTDEPLPKASIRKKEAIQKAIVRKWLSVGCIFIGIILSCLMPLFAKLYQGFEMEHTQHCLTNASEYIFQFPLLGILLVAILFLSVGMLSLYFSARKKSAAKLT